MSAYKRSRGLTLTEMLVSTGVLALIILIAAEMLASTQATIHEAEKAADLNADARAVADRLRRDLMKITQDGLLLVMIDEQYRPRLVFTAVGVHRSLCDSQVTANAARIAYGLYRNYKDTPKDPSDDYNILYRQAILLDPKSPAGSSGYQNDHERMCLSYVHMEPRFAAGAVTSWLYSMKQQLYSITGKFSPDGVTALPYVANVPWTAQSVIPELQFPINNLDDVNRLWPYMVSGVTEMKIQWTDGSVDGQGRLQWFDRDHARDQQWRQKIPAFRYLPNSPYTPEYAFDVGYWLPDPVYCALWLFDRKAVWPKGIRVQFKVGPYGQERKYDVIVDLPNT